MDMLGPLVRTGEPLDFTACGPGEPSSPNNNEDCLYNFYFNETKNIFLSVLGNLLFLKYIVF